MGCLVLPPAQSNYLWRLSWISLASGIYGLTQGYYDLAAVPLGVWLTSINYWRSPDFSWRRYLDITYVHMSLTYQILRSIDAQYRVPYWITLGVGVGFFPIGCYLHGDKSGCQWPSTLCHGMVHIFANISNFILYSGFVPTVTNAWFINKYSLSLPSDCLKFYSNDCVLTFW
jgi:hypothetical protein